MIYQYYEIKTVHLEITEKCNASCTQCGRNINGGEVNPYLKDRELSLNSIQKIFTEPFVKQLSHIYLCGSYGDPIVAKDTLEILKYFRQINPNILLSLNTNASARTNEYWIELAEILKPNGYIIFSIDGLEDTNHIYRRGTNWNKIISNVNSFISAGGNAYWEYIVFEHNEHQVDIAKEFASALGFKNFQVKKTARFFSSLTGLVKEGSNFIDKKGNKIEIKTPKNPAYRNKGLDIIQSNILPVVTLPTTVDEIKDKVNPELFNHSAINLYDSAKIDCKVKKEKNIYVSAEGLVLPCCWIANSIYSWQYMYKRTQIWKHINKVGLDNINAHNKSIKEIVEGNFFSIIEQSWKLPTCKQGKLTVCSKTCGENLETFDKQYK